MMTDYAIPPAATRILLDPFGFYGATRSRIGGLGSSGTLPYDRFAFHTPYTPLGGGEVQVTLSFLGLQASMGTLSIQVNLLPESAEPPVRRIAETLVTLPDLVQEDGIIRLDFDALAGASYAIEGIVEAETDAVARALQIAVEARDLNDAMREQLFEARTGFLTDGGSDASSCPALISSAKATMARPSSQMCTASQMDEPAYKRWLGVLGEPARFHRKQWEVIYILQVLDSAGMLRPGRKGLGFAVGREPLPAIMAAHGVEILATDLPEDHASTRLWSTTNQHGCLDALRYPQLCVNTIFDRNVSFRAVNMTDIPDDLGGFDFCWSACAFEHLGSIEAGLSFVQRSLDPLRPGGISVHTTEFNVTSNDLTMEHRTTSLFRRRDMEVLALRLIAEGHDVAQIKLDSGEHVMDDHVDVPPYANDPHLKMALMRYVTTSFGIIVRKGRPE
jgi:hypothetical protein